MRITSVFWLVFFISSVTGPVCADVPPDPGFVRQTANLTLETADDFPQYRFFIVSLNNVEEIHLVKGKPTVLTGSGRGGATRVGTLWAIPVATIGEDLGASAQEKLLDLRSALKEKRLNGAVDLLTHNFQTTIRKEDRVNWKDPVYRIENDENNGVKSIRVSGGGDPQTKVVGGSPFYSTEPKTWIFWASVVGGSLLTLVLITAGVWAFRPKRAKNTV